MKANKVYVIIVTYNAMKWVDQCFGSLRKSEVPVTPVVIDNLSKDETVDYIRTRYPEVHLIVNNENRGFGQANNQGIEWAYKQGATHFFLLNQDAWVHPDTIGRLVEVQDKNHIDIVSPIHLNGQGDELDFGFQTYVLNSDNNLVSDYMTGNIKEFYNAEMINAAAWMLSRETIETIGGFDPLFFHYGEDVNYIQRINYHHKKLAFIPNAFIHHDRYKVGNQQMFNKRETISYLLNAYANINVSIIRPKWSRVRLHLWNIKKFFLSLITANFQSSKRMILSYFDAITKIKSIIKSRKRNKISGPNWLFQH